MRPIQLVLSAFLLCLSTSDLVANDAVDRAIQAVRSVDVLGEGFEQAIPAAKTLQELSPSEIPRILDGAKDANPLAENWFRGVVFGIARKSGTPGVPVLQAYVANEQNNAIGRALAMELIRLENPALAKSMIDERLHDSSLSIREMAVEQAIEAAKAIEKSDPDSAKGKYRSALDAARHPKQLSRIVETLNKLGDPVTTAGAFSLMTQWKAVAPFDNSGGVGFNQAYAPEASFAASGVIDTNAKYDGKSGPITWTAVEGSADEGMIDLAAAFNKEKGAVAYLYAEFESSQDQPAQARLGCINANKVWINGKEIMANEVYHAGSMLDQYVAPVELKKGTNRILLKICQNEQEESWAQRWELQFRLTDPTGKGLVSIQP